MCPIAITLKYKIMFNPSVRNIFVLKNYFKPFECSVYVSKNDDERKINGKSLLGWLSLGLIKYDTITLFFSDNVNVQNIKRHFRLII